MALIEFRQMKTQLHLLWLCAATTGSVVFTSPFCQAAESAEASRPRAERKGSTAQTDLNLLPLESAKGSPKAPEQAASITSSALGFQPTQKSKVAGMHGTDAITGDQKTVAKLVFLERYPAGLRYDYSEAPVVAGAGRTKEATKVAQPEVPGVRQKLDTFLAHRSYPTRDEEAAGKWYERAVAQKLSASYDSVWSRGPDGQYRYLTKDQETVERWFAPAGGRDVFSRGRFLDSMMPSAWGPRFGYEFEPGPPLPGYYGRFGHEFGPGPTGLR